MSTIVCVMCLAITVSLFPAYIMFLTFTILNRKYPAIGYSVLHWMVCYLMVAVPCAPLFVILRFLEGDSLLYKIASYTMPVLGFVVVYVTQAQINKLVRCLYNKLSKKD